MAVPLVAFTPAAGTVKCGKLTKNWYTQVSSWLWNPNWSYMLQVVISRSLTTKSLVHKVVAFVLLPDLLEFLCSLFVLYCCFIFLNLSKRNIFVFHLVTLKSFCTSIITHRSAWTLALIHLFLFFSPFSEVLKWEGCQWFVWTSFNQSTYIYVTGSSFCSGLDPPMT